MKSALLPALIFSLALTVFAQDQGSAPPASLDRGNAGFGEHGGRGFGGGMGMGMGRGLIGTVTSVAQDHYIVKIESGESYTVYFSVNTRLMKQMAGPRGSGGQRRDGGQGAEGNMGRGGNPPEPIKPADIKVGDAVAAMGEIDSGAKTIGAIAILQLDPERARQMEEMQANYGKTWIMGKVTAIDGVKVTLLGSIDNAPHAFVADENTTFRQRREPITLADIQMGDMVRAEGAVKDGVFAAAAVNVMKVPPDGTPSVPRNAPPQ